jgi:hypothetical protein
MSAGNERSGSVGRKRGWGVIPKKYAIVCAWGVRMN